MPFLCVSGADNSGKEDVKKYTDTLLFDLDNAMKLLNNLSLRGNLKYYEVSYTPHTLYLNFCTVL